MPFKFNFYEKFGFGFLGGMINTSFEPNNIKIDPVCEGNWLPFTGNKEHLLDMYDVHDIWVRNFTGGIKSRRLPLARFMEGIKWSKDKLFLYYKNNEYKAYIRFRLNIKSIHVTDIEIRKAAWKDKEGFSGLLHFLKSHRDQCKNIKWQLPNNIPLHLVFKNPRIFQQYQHDYMIRPLDVEKVLRLKAGYTPATEKIAFSIEDPVISDNSPNLRVLR